MLPQFITEYPRKHRLSFRVIYYILICSTFFTLISTAIQLYLEYRRDIGKIEDGIHLIQRHASKSITLSVWTIDDQQVATLLKELLSLPDIQSLKVFDVDNTLLASAGARIDDEPDYVFPLVYHSQNIGNMHVYVDLHQVHSRMYSRIMLILGTQIIKTFLWSFIVFFIFQYLIMRHLNTITKYLKEFNINGFDNPMLLERKLPTSHEPDELDHVVSTFNNMLSELSIQIKERQKSEEKLKVNEIILNKAQKMAHIGSWHFDIEKDIISWSDETYRIFGIIPEKFGATFQAFLDTIHPEDKEMVERAYLNAIAQKMPYECVHRIIRPNGEVRVVLEKSEEIVDESGKTIHSFGMVHDITEFKEVEKQIVKAKEEWEMTFDAISDIITIQDKDMRIVRANKAMYQMFQAKPENIIGKYCYEVFREANKPCPYCPELDTLNDLLCHSENIAHENLGKMFNVTTTPLSENNDCQYIVHIAKDITEHKKMEADLFQAHKMEAIGTLAGGIAHDFNNILGAILGYADMAKEDLPERSHINKYLDQVLKAGNRAKELVKQILAFSRKSQETRQPMQPYFVIKEALKLMRASLPTTIEIQEEIDSASGSILANPTNIHQILINLCTNARHSIEDEQGVLTVTLRQVELNEEEVISRTDIAPGRFVELMVSDTGHGMTKEIIERIFEPYFTTKEVGKGSGMGLAVVHGIVKSCDGFIEVDTLPGKGSTFKVYFPSVIEEKTGEVENKKQGPLPNGYERILVVDDEESMVDMYKAILEKLGYVVTAHTSSKTALEVFQSSPEDLDLLITDQTMPHFTGSELAKQILKIRPDIPIILCTGYSSIISKEQAKDIGIARFVMKPVSKRDLAITVREVLDKSNFF